MPLRQVPIVLYIYRKRWYLANVKLDMFISILYVNIANLKSVPIEIFAEILNVFMIVRNIRQNSDVFYIEISKVGRQTPCTNQDLK